MEESILISVKKMLGISEEYKHFDLDLIIHINSVFSILNQLGAGTDETFSITDESAVWGDFLSTDISLNVVKSYMHLKVKLLFDPPLSTAVLESINRMISEFEWRIQVAADKEEING